jgi:hypothetical protein
VGVVVAAPGVFGFVPLVGRTPQLAQHSGDSADDLSLDMIPQAQDFRLVCLAGPQNQHAVL